MLLLDRQHRAVVSSRGQAHPARSKLMKRSLLARIACLAFALGVTFCFFIQYCDLLFDCGCRALWAGRADNCNIHNAAPPHCPWCLDDGAYGRWAHAAIVIAQAGLALWPGSFGKAARCRRIPGVSCRRGSGRTARRSRDRLLAVTTGRTSSREDTSHCCKVV